jgi:hypothetical protein
VQLPQRGSAVAESKICRVAELLEQKIKELNRMIRQSQSEEEKLLGRIPEIGPWVPWA